KGYAGVFFPNGRRQVNAQEQTWASLCKDQLDDLIAGLAQYCGDDPRLLPNGGDMMFPSKVAPGLVRALAQLPDVPEIRFATVEQALDAIPWDRKPVVGGEFQSSQKGTFTTNIQIKQRNQRYSRMLESLETLAAVRGQRMDFALAWKLVLKQQFHDILCGTICDAAMDECDRDFEAVRMLLEDALRRCSPNDEEPGFFNALPFARAAEVLVEGKPCRITVPAFGFAPLAEAKPLPIQKEQALPCAFENEWYRVEIDAQGYVRSLKEKQTGIDLVGAAQTHQGQSIPFGSLVMQVDNGDGWELFETPRSYVHEHEGYNYNLPDPYDREEQPYWRKVGP
ncbi:MAG TPA: hypothetical protein PKE04_20560, partial [Clostridia bacterium]|nr:hypothetical protein [Clostridia bacterium]